MSIVSVQFQSVRRAGEFSGREYNYFSNVELNPGDVILVPTKTGKSVVRVCRTDVADSEIEEDVRPLMRTIEEIILPEQSVEEVLYEY